MHPIIPIAGVFLGVAGFMEFRKKKCTKCRRNVRVAGMVGACCKSCADGHECDSDDEEEAAEYYGTGRSRYKNKRRRF